MARIIVCSDFNHPAEQIRIMVNRITSWRKAQGLQAATDLTLDNGQRLLVLGWPRTVECAVLDPEDVVVVDRG